MSKLINNEIVVIGVVYPGIERFLKDSFDSLERQSKADFDVLIANDKLANINSFLETSELNVQIFNVSGTHSSNRRSLIHRAIEGNYRKIIFADFDDMFESNRIQVISDLLDKSAVVVNDSDLVGLEGDLIKSRYFSQRYGEAEKITERHLLNGNMMGLANTAAQANVFIDNPAILHGDSVAFDWYLWSSILLKGNSAIFTTKTATKYRVYNDNMAGLPQALTIQNIRRGVEVKRQHYALIANLDDSYKELAEEFKHTSNMLKNKQWGSEYLKLLKENAIENHIWWENIRTPKEMRFK